MNNYYSVIFIGFLLLQACSTGQHKLSNEILSLSVSQSKLRSAQTHAFDVTDQNLAMRSVLAALQDLGFIIERANNSMGLVTAGKPAPDRKGLLELTVMVQKNDKRQTEIRVSALYNTRPIKNPEIYQRFFNVVERSMVLTKH